MPQMPKANPTYLADAHPSSPGTTHVIEVLIDRIEQLEFAVGHMAEQTDADALGRLTKRINALETALRAQDVAKTLKRIEGRLADVSRAVARTGAISKSVGKLDMIQQVVSDVQTSVTQVNIAASEQFVAQQTIAKLLTDMNKQLSAQEQRQTEMVSSLAALQSLPHDLDAPSEPPPPAPKSRLNLPGAGPVLLGKLTDAGILSNADLVRADIETLDTALGDAAALIDIGYWIEEARRHPSL